VVVELPKEILRAGYRVIDYNSLRGNAEEGDLQQEMSGRNCATEEKMVAGQNPIANPVAVLREEFDDWAVLFNPDTAEAVGVNPVGVSIWKLMDGRRSVEEIAASLREGYDQVPDGVAEEVDRFVADLAERGFVGYEVEGSRRKAEG
jgi:SynChlorMet cassette protein ScmD